MRNTTWTDRLTRYLFPALAIGVFAVGTTQAGYVDEILAQNPLEYYRLSDTSAEISSPTNDVTANAVVLGATTAPTLDAAGGFAGFTDNSWGTFDGLGSSVLTNVVTGWSTDEGSISYWVNPTGSGDTTKTGVFANAPGGSTVFGGGGNTDYVATFLRTNGSLGINVDGTQLDSGTGILTNGQWQHVAHTWDRNTGAGDGVIRTYVNGALVAQTTTGSWDSVTLSNAVRFGKEIGGATREYLGAADEIAFFSTALTAADIRNQVLAAHVVDNSQQLLRYSFEQPGTVAEGASDTIYDVSGQGNDGTVASGANTAATVDGERGDVLSKTGTAGIDVDLDSTSKTYTFVGWYKGTDSDGYFFDQETSRFVLGGGGIVAGSSLGVYDGTWHDTNLDGFRDGEWHHIAFTFNNTNGTDVFTAYVDGSASAQNNQVLTNGIVDLSSTNRQKFASNFAGSAAGMNGLFDELAVYDRAMTPGEINGLIIKPQTDGLTRAKVLTVDIGSVGQPIQFDGLADEFSEFSFTNGSGTTADGQSDTYNGITVTIESSSGTVGYRDRGGVSHTVGDLINDFVFAGTASSDVEIDLTLSGLAAGHYDIVLYSHDIGTHDDFEVLVDGIDTGVIVESSTGATPSVIGFGIVSFSADGTSDVVITLRQLNTTGDSNIVFNGFELYFVPAPAALPVGLAMLGLMIVRRPRR